MKNLVVYIHGKGGTAAESKHYKKFFPNTEVIGFDYKAENVWEAKEEFQKFFKPLENVTIIANSIGAFYAMHALSEKNIDRAFFISPFIDMENFILEMLKVANVTEENLREAKEFISESGENLSWKYLCYVRENPIVWKVPTHILCGDRDLFTPLESMKKFATQINATLTVMQGGTHFFHTPEQIIFLDNWLSLVVG